MHGEVEEDQIVDLLEGRADDPAVVPVDGRVRGDDVADQPGAHRLAHIGEMRRPAAVLVDGELDAVPVGEFDQPLAGVEIDDERFLRQHMLAGLERRLDQRHALGRMRRDVEHLDVVAAKQALEIVGGDGVGVELVAPRLGARQRARHDRRDIETGAAVGVEMREGNAPCPDQRDLRPVVFGHRRPVGQLRRRDFRHRLADQRIVGFGGKIVLAHGSSFTVRFSRAESTALSVICWPMRDSFGSSGPEIFSPVAIR